VVQLGWAICEGPAGEIAALEERTIAPDGWEVSQKAALYHGVTQEQAQARGSALAVVLAEFLAVARAVCSRGGRLVAHHLEFDACIIATEMRRAGMAAEAVQEWDALVRSRGFCTMCPELGRWLCQRFGRDAGGSTVMNTLQLREVVRWLIPPAERSEPRFHTALFDARMHGVVFRELLNRARAA
jgi:hypothetical protein